MPNFVSLESDLSLTYFSPLGWAMRSVSGSCRNVPAMAWVITSIAQMAEALLFLRMSTVAADASEMEARPE